MQTLAESGVYEFGGFRLELKNHRLERLSDGETIAITAKVAELLIYLVENRGRTILKNELLEAVWQNAFVEESNLSQSIFMLRKALGDNTRTPRFILTLPNRGYQFIAEIKESGRNADTDYVERNSFEKNGTADPDAYRSYVQGRFFWNKRTETGLKEAVENFEKAISQDPNFARAYAGLADSHRLLAEYYTAAIPNEARAPLNKELIVDDKMAEAHASLAYAQAFYDWDWDSAEISFRRAIELNPFYATGHQWYSDYLSVLGRFDQAYDHALQAIELDPASPIIATNLASYFYRRREADKLIEQAEKIIEMDPEFAYGYFYLGFGYEFNGMYDEAVDAFVRAAILFGEPADCAEELREIFKRNGMDEMWRKRLEQYETRPHLKNHPTYLRAMIPIRLGDNETTLELLEKAYEQRDRGIIYAKHEPLLEPLRGDPRFEELIRRIGL